tara:strand:+ start:607 stop:1644 length:1038 start_codon:yes stop_codon:yes gene_type:complete
MNANIIEIIQPDDWHTHLREGEILKAVAGFTSRINNRCIAMPNLSKPIINTDLAKEYKQQIKKIIINNSFTPLIPCYLTESIDLDDFDYGLKNDIFIGAKLYPNNSTTNSHFGISNIEKVFPAFEVLEKNNKNLLIHGEKNKEGIDIFDREKYFIDDELLTIRNKFPNLKIILEHISSKYGADFVAQNKNIAGTITPQHMLITKKDIYFENSINPHNFCMPVVKNESDLLALRKYACSGNEKFFLGTDSAPHLIEDKILKPPKPGIFSSPCSIELYTEIFSQENSLENLEKFSSINGPKFYNLPVNNKKIKISNEEWILEEYTIHHTIKIKNFFGGKKLNWKVLK